ncbi:MAG TPA: hypothetical protein VN719_10650 [Gemmatimonadales bacterium]|nr:hypothetical protein [Gemmatimonadales bacterium]
MSGPSLATRGRQIGKGYEVLSPQKKNVGNGQGCNENGSALVAVGERKAEEPGSVMDRLEDVANELHGTMIEHV